MFKPQSMSLAVAVCLSAGLGQVQAAESFAQIKSLKGDVMVTQGERFVTAREGMALQQLDRIVVLEQGGATIEFQDGCRHQMNEMELLTVGATNACRSKDSDYQAVEQTATSQISARSTTGTAAGSAGGTAAGSAAGTAAGSAAGAAAGAAGTAAGAATGLGATIAGLGAATGLGVAGVVGVGALAVAGVAVAVNEATKSDDDDPEPPISGE